MAQAPNYSLPKETPNHSENTNQSLMTHLRMLVRRRDFQIAAGLTLVCIITRIMALPASLWEWDDILFAKAIHRFDLVAHSPHPPGFPVFVIMARAAFVFLRDEHHALAAVSLIFSSGLGAALYFFYHEIFRDKWMALAGALFCSLAPNVWVQSGSARSDSPGLTIGIIALGLILNGVRSRNSLWLGCAVFGLGMGVRVTVLPVVAPTLAVVLIIQLLRRQWRIVAISLSIAAAGILCWYVPLVLHTTWPVYRRVMNQHAQFTFNTDTIISPTENSVISYRLRRFFVDIWGAQWIMLTIYTLGIIGFFASILSRRWRLIGWMCVAFIPFLIFTLLLNTPLSAPLYSLPYIPFFTGMAAVGMVEAVRFLSGKWRSVAISANIVLIFGLTVAIGSWSYPVIRMLHREISPPLRAIQELRQRLDPAEDIVYFDGLFTPHLSFFMPDVKAFLNTDQTRADINLIAPGLAKGKIYGLTTGPAPGAEGKGFHWSQQKARSRLKRVSMGRYFDNYVTDLTNTSRLMFLSGWYDEERTDSQSWRWMSGQGKVALLVTAEAMKLYLKGVLPLDPTRGSATVTLRLDGQEIDRFIPESRVIERLVTVRPDPTRLWSTLIIETNQTVTPSRINSSADNRELGLQCYSLEWRPAENARLIPRSEEQFLGPGWYQLEHGNRASWRWTKEEAIAYLPATSGDARLDLRLSAPDRGDGSQSEISVALNGKVVDKFSPPPGVFFRSYFVPGSFHQGGQTELRLSGKGISAPSDPRQVAIQVYYLGWNPSAGQPGKQTSGVEIIK